MNKKVYARIALSLLLALAVLAGCLFSMNYQAKSATADSGKVDGYATYLFLSAANATADANGTGKVVVDYGWLDCYQTTDVASAQLVTVTMQHSPDNSVWVNGNALTAASADGTTYTSMPISGTYMRASMDVNGEANVTVTVKCTAKDLTR